MRARVIRTCTLCGRAATGSRARCPDCVGVHRPRGAWTVHPSLPFELDHEARRFVREHPRGATYEELADVLGITKEAVRVIVDGALAKLRARSARLAVYLERRAA